MASESPSLAQMLTCSILILFQYDNPPGMPLAKSDGVMSSVVSELPSGVMTAIRLVTLIERSIWGGSAGGLILLGPKSPMPSVPLFDRAGWALFALRDSKLLLLLLLIVWVAQTKTPCN